MVSEVVNWWSWALIAETALLHWSQIHKSRSAGPSNTLNKEGNDI